MSFGRLRRFLAVFAGSLLGVGLILVAAFRVFEDRIVYRPSHNPPSPHLAAWLVDGQYVGYAREAVQPRTVWLVFQGNGGQAGPRAYFARVPNDESIYVMEYPGYGPRFGALSAQTINAAASAAYHELRRRFPGVPIGVVGESFGSGPASLLARDAAPPDRFVFFVPLARLDLVTDRFVPLLPMRLLLRDNWNNLTALAGYRGPVKIYAAEKDEVIPREHTLMLAAAVPAAKLVWVPGGHGSSDALDSVTLGP